QCLIHMPGLLASRSIQRCSQIGDDLSRLLERGPEVGDTHANRRQLVHGCPNPRDEILKVGVDRRGECEDLDLQPCLLVSEDLPYDERLRIAGIPLHDVSDTHRLMNKHQCLPSVGSAGCWVLGAGCFARMLAERPAARYSIPPGAAPS